MSSVYHILYQVPTYNKEEMLVEYEHLANKLVASGKMRIDADTESNFVRFSDNSLNLSALFSDTELTDPKILEETIDNLKKIYSKKYSGNSLTNKVNQIISQLKNDLKKNLSISTEKQINLARLFVQAAHPIVIKWLLLEKVEILISYSHNIGDMMDIPNWAESGSNSGMQSTDGKKVAVFVSCGGDPLGANSKEYFTFGDGWPAISRMLVIAGQELGHYADIIRDDNGRQIGRHSAENWGRKPTQIAREGRIADIKRSKNFAQILQNMNIETLCRYETNIKFYRDNKQKNLNYLFYMILAFINKKLLMIKAHNENLHFVKLFDHDEFTGLMLKIMIGDMLFNLEPKADVYRRDNKEEEEAIACIEALARVPQQALKWGHVTTKYMMGDLYKIYYHNVIPSLITQYQKITNSTYRRNYQIMPKSIKYYLNKFLDFLKFKKPDFNPRKIAAR